MAVTYYDTTVENVPVKYFKALHSDVSIYGARNGITGSQAKTNKVYGVNGTFFQMSTKGIYGVAVNNGSVVSVNTYGSYGGSNNHADLDSFLCGTKTKIGNAYVRLTTKSNFPFYTATSPIETIEIQDARWAIGGHNLLLNSSFSSESAFISKLSSGAKIYGPSSKTQRTFIGSDGTNVYLCTAHSKCTMYEEHKILKKLGCNIGINLDGGGSTFISHKNGSMQSESRAVPTVVRVNY